MKVEELRIENFRNISAVTLRPDDTINFLVGANGQGKTSLIEAIGFLSSLRSFRGSKSIQVIRRGAESSVISCDLTSGVTEVGEWRTNLRLVFEANETKKTAFINEKLYRNSTQYISQRFHSSHLGFHAIVFNPSDHELIRGEPARRRSYLDQVISAENVEYLGKLQRYRRVLEQRNALLKSNQRFTSDILNGFTEPLCQYGAYLAHQRLKWLLKLAFSIGHIIQQIAPMQPLLNPVYLSNWIPEIENLSYNNASLNFIHFSGQGLLPSLELLEQSFRTKVLALESAERKAGFSLVGPHRDDWAIFLGNGNLKGQGSQGEIRTALLALKLSEIHLFQDETGQRPIFLLDDFSSELDRERRLFLLRFLSGTDLQTFVTTTEDSPFVGRRYWVKNGGVKDEGKNDERSEPTRLS